MGLTPLMALVVTCACSVAAADPPSPANGAEIVALWPEGAPDAIGNEESDKPILMVRRPDPAKSKGVAMIVCPGGGYSHLAWTKEGEKVADWLVNNGITACVLRYRHGPRYLHPAPLQDGERAVRTVRARAEEWGLDKKRIGMLGFSAGGHLAATVGTHFTGWRPFALDPIDRVSSRPDFMILIYPVISLMAPNSHRGTLKNLLGHKVSESLKRDLSNEYHVTKKTPPTFLVHTSNDRTVSSANSALFYLALREAGVPAEIHIYEQGKHGFGLAEDDPVLSTWPGHCLAWLRTRGILE
ncbi:MAG: alpha/beta hydrolase [bacterium]|nr:alpha/beta hydrolase [bacterium]